MMRLLKNLIPETSWIRLQFHALKADIAAIVYGLPARNLTVIGITGTDGKTTTVGMVAHILNACGIKTGALSTAFFQIGNSVTWNPTQKTSPSPFMIQKFLRRLVKEGCTHVVLECSSHGLLQGRLRHTFPVVAAITNVSEEHLDYHGTMEDYVRAKAILFRMLRGRGTKVLHDGDLSFDLLSGIPAQKTIIYGAEHSDRDERYGPPMHLWLEDVEPTAKGSSGSVVWYDKNPTETIRTPVSLRIPGLFNLENALCAIGCVRGLSDAPPMEKAIAALRDFSGVPGRMERIDAGQLFSVYVDFTVTPKSYASTLSTLKSMLAPSRRLLVLMGSCGDRMKEKRPVIGRIASQFADVIVVANEDPYTEDPEKIIDDVIAGMPTDLPVFREDTLPSSVPQKYCLRIFDRLRAIRALLKVAEAGDIVILCGKGSDITMMMKDGQVPWNEREIVRRELTRLSSGG